MVNTSLVKSKVLDKTPIYAKISRKKNPILYPDFYHPQSSSMFICTNSRMNFCTTHIPCLSKTQ